MVTHPRRLLARSSIVGRVCVLFLFQQSFSLALSSHEAHSRQPPQDSTFHRRKVLAYLSTAVVSASLSHPALALDKSPMNTIVTESDLGVSVRRSVVRAAQFMDRVDGSWERLSDQWGLGEARQQRDSRPVPKSIPDLKPLDREFAVMLLDAADQAVAQCLGCSISDVRRQVESVETMVLPSFQRSGLNVKADSLLEPSNADDFNFLSYCHYKAYIELFSKQSSVSFVTLKQRLEEALGAKVLQTLLPSFQYEKGDRCAQWRQAVAAMDQLLASLVTRGLLASVDPVVVDAESLGEWCDSGGELTFSLALDGEATLNAQVLLQEQGYRLYPSFCKHGLRAILQGIDEIEVTIDDYFMDTDYNSDPDRFQVKELLLNVVLDSRD